MATQMRILALKLGIVAVLAGLPLTQAIAKEGHEKASGDAGMNLHHMHIALNHALEMAAEGSNLVMMGQMKMAKGVDRHTIDHGRQMIEEARKLWRDVMGSSAMAEMHQAGTTPEKSDMMMGTHKLAEDQKKGLDLLANMPALK